MRGNAFLGNGVGRVGDIVVYRSRGELITRSINLHPHNPKSAAQVVQRVLLKTISSAWSLISSAAGHCWQGAAWRTECQNAYMRANYGWLRDFVFSQLELSENIFSCSACNFLGLFQRGCAVMPWALSHGPLPTMGATWSAGSARLGPFGVVLEPGFTYAALISALGVSRGDTLRFIWFFVDDIKPTGLFAACRCAAVVLEPAGGNIDAAFLGEEGGVNEPNVNNEGSIYFSLSAGGTSLTFSPFVLSWNEAEALLTPAGCVCVCERGAGVPSFSTECIALRPFGASPGALTHSYNVLEFGAACRSMS